MSRTIENKEEAEAALLGVAVFLEGMAESAAKKDPDEWMDDTDAEILARAMCQRLLQAAQADGLGGCRLCRS